MHLETTEQRPPTRTEVARWVSIIIHPIVFPLVALGIGLYLATYSLQSVLGWIVMAIALTSLPVAFLVVIQVIRHKWTDLDVSVRRQRYILYPFGIVCMLALTLSYVHFDAPAIAVRSGYALVIANMVDGAINLGYKVSAHATGAAASAALIWLTTPFLGLSIVAVFAALLVGWSRVELKRHTRGQVLLGWLVGVLAMVIAFHLPVPTHI
jgi:membrane-associated phospholipid phosphatase